MHKTERYYKTGKEWQHRRVWRQAHGPIPRGYVVHHKDGDGFNNDLSNLELMEKSEHARMHANERIASGDLKPPSPEALQKAAEWHASPQGLRWHSENGKRAWIDRVLHEKVCLVCKGTFMTPYPNKTKFCHANCRAVDFRRRHRK
jgi:hypothetical protein